MSSPCPNPLLRLWSNGYRLKLQVWRKWLSTHFHFVFKWRAKGEIANDNKRTNERMNDVASQGTNWLRFDLQQQTNNQLRSGEQICQQIIFVWRVEENLDEVCVTTLSLLLLRRHRAHLAPNSSSCLLFSLLFETLKCRVSNSFMSYETHWNRWSLVKISHWAFSRSAFVRSFDRSKREENRRGGGWRFLSFRLLNKSRASLLNKIVIHLLTRNRTKHWLQKLKDKMINTHHYHRTDNWATLTIALLSYLQRCNHYCSCISLDRGTASRKRKNTCTHSLGVTRSKSFSPFSCFSSSPSPSSSPFAFELFFSHIVSFVLISRVEILLKSMSNTKRTEEQQQQQQRIKYGELIILGYVKDFSVFHRDKFVRIDLDFGQFFSQFRLWFSVKFIGQRPGAPMNADWLFRLCVNVYLNGLGRRDVLPFHHPSRSIGTDWDRAEIERSVASADLTKDRNGVRVARVPGKNRIDDFSFESRNRPTVFCSDRTTFDET